MNTKCVVQHVGAAGDNRPRIGERQCHAVNAAGDQIVYSTKRTSQMARRPPERCVLIEMLDIRTRGHDDYFEIGNGCERGQVAGCQK
jgi:hypothetical protein